MSEHQIKEQQTHETLAARAAQEAFGHSMAAIPAVMINGFSLSTVGRMPRLVFTENTSPSTPPHPRAAVVMHPEDLVMLIRGAQELLEKLQEAGLWAPPAAQANGQDHATH